MTIKVLSVNISIEKGTTKKPVDSITLDAMGIQSDAHAGSWHRQVSLLGKESIDKFGRQSDRTFEFGDFAENITTEGISLVDCSVGDRMTIGEVEMEVTQIGKKCHGGGCAIYQEVGKCVMPKEGIFCRVLAGGTITPGDEIIYDPRPVKIHIITLSDRASRGEYEDRSGPAIKTSLDFFYAEQNQWNAVITNTIIPDDAEQLIEKVEAAVADGANVIFTTGGTGIGPRDITPETIRPMLDKEIPGIMEFIRVKYGETIPSALLSRSIAGVIGGTLIYTLPGSVKAVKEYTDEILKTLNHSILMMLGIDAH